MCFSMSSRCHVLIITPRTAGRCRKTASSTGSRFRLWFSVIVCVCVRVKIIFNNMIMHDILGTKKKKKKIPQPQLCCSLSPPSILPRFPSVSACPRSREMCEVSIEFKFSKEVACRPFTLCGLVTLWLCGVILTCPLALPINYRWNQVQESIYSKHNTISHPQVRAGSGDHHDINKVYAWMNQKTI